MGVNIRKGKDLEQFLDVDAVLDLVLDERARVLEILKKKTEEFEEILMVKYGHLQGVGFECSRVEIQFILVIKEEYLLDDVILLNGLIDEF